MIKHINIIIYKVLEDYVCQEDTFSISLTYDINGIIILDQELYLLWNIVFKVWEGLL